MPYVFFGVAGLEAGLAEHRGLLVAEDARQRAAADRRALGLAVLLARGLDLGQHRPRHAHQVERSSCQSSVSRSISSVRLALVTSVTWRPPSLPAGEVPQHPAVGGAEQQLAVLRPLAGAVDVVEHPRDLRAGEVGGERQAGDVAQPVDALVAGQLAHEPAGAGVLPDDRVVDRLAGLAVPDHGRLALVGDADRLDVTRLDVGVGHRAVDHAPRVLPDLGRVVLDPARLGVDLLVLTLVDVTDVAVLVEQDEARAGRALVDRSDEFAHVWAAPPGSSMAVSAASSISGSGSAPRAISTSRTA